MAAISLLILSTGEGSKCRLGDMYQQRGIKITSAADLDPGLFLPPVYRIREYLDPDSGSGMNITDHNSEKIRNNFLGLKYLEFYDADPDPGSGMEKFGSGIRNKRSGYATL